MMLFGLFGQLLLHHLVASEGYLLKAYGLKHHNLLLRDRPHPSSYLLTELVNERRRIIYYRNARLQV